MMGERVDFLLFVSLGAHLLGTVLSVAIPLDSPATPLRFTWPHSTGKTDGFFGEHPSRLADYFQSTDGQRNVNVWPPDFQPNAWRHQEVSQLRPRPHRHLDINGVLDRSLPREVFTAVPRLVRLNCTEAVFLFHDSSSTVYLFPLGEEDRHWMSFRVRSADRQDGAWPEQDFLFRSLTATDDGGRVLLYGGGDFTLSPPRTSSDIFLWSAEGFSVKKVLANGPSPESSGKLAFSSRSSPSPSRMLRSAVFVSDQRTRPSLYVFGGGTEGSGWSRTVLNDLWRFQFDDDLLLSGNWERLDSGEASEPPSGAVLPALFHARNALIAYGGINSCNNYIKRQQSAAC